MSVASIADQISHTAAAVLIVAAAGVTVVGLVRAWRGRCRDQLVIPDITDPGGFGDSVTAGLSSLLRQQVRRRLSTPTAPGVDTLAETVKPDVALGVLVLEHTRIGDVVRINEVMATQRDELATVADGIRGLAPSQAAGILGVLSAALPQQRGVIVVATPLIRAVAGVEQTGLTIDVGPLGRAPDASATFWSAGTPIVATDNSAARRSELYDLLEPAAKWIALHVIGTTLTVEARRRWWRRDPNEAITTSARDERVALRALLTAQLAGYEMNAAIKQPTIALGFGDQALEDANRAMRTFPKYHRPRYLIGAIHEHLGNCYSELHRTLTGDAASVPAYAAMAATAYATAAREFGEAEGLLKSVQLRVDPPPPPPSAAHAAMLARLAVRRLKAGLRGPDAHECWQYLRSAELPSTTPTDRYNIACLYAVSAVVGARLQMPTELDRRRCVQHLSYTVLVDTRYAAKSRADPDLATLAERAQACHLALAQANAPAEDREAIARQIAEQVCPDPTTGTAR